MAKFQTGRNKTGDSMIVPMPLRKGIWSPEQSYSTWPGMDGSKLLTLRVVIVPTVRLQERPSSRR